MTAIVPPQTWPIHQTNLQFNELVVLENVQLIYPLVLINK